MKDFETELENMVLDEMDEPEAKLPSLEEQRAIAAKLKQLEADGKLTPEILEEYFSQYYANTDTPIH